MNGKNIETFTHHSGSSSRFELNIDFLECTLNREQARTLKNALTGFQVLPEKVETDNEFIDLIVTSNGRNYTLKIEGELEDTEELTLDDETEKELLEELNRFLQN